MAGEFCPNCGTTRIGALRFCRSCGFDFDTLTLGTGSGTPVGSPKPDQPPPSIPPTSAPRPTMPQPAEPAAPAAPPQSAAPSPPTSPAWSTTEPVPPAAVKQRGLPLRLIAIGTAVVVVAAVLASSLTGPQPSAPVAGGALPTPTERPTSRSTPRPTPTQQELTPTVAPTPPEATPGTYVPGDVVTITSNDEPYLEILVDKVSVQSKYDGQYLDDTPEVKGNVFIQARVTYTSLQNGATYNPFDWNVFVDDRAVDSYAFVTNGPEPQLSSGDLPKGRTAQGWLVYEVPATGRVVLSYRANMFTNDAPVFEVVLRSK